MEIPDTNMGIPGEPSSPGMAAPFVNLNEIRNEYPDISAEYPEMHRGGGSRRKVKVAPGEVQSIVTDKQGNIISSTTKRGWVRIEEYVDDNGNVVRRTTGFKAFRSSSTPGALTAEEKKEIPKGEFLSLGSTEQMEMFISGLAAKSLKKKTMEEKEKEAQIKLDNTLEGNPQKINEKAPGQHLSGDITVKKDAVLVPRIPASNSPTTSPSSDSFSGNVYVAGNKIPVTGTADAWIKVTIIDDSHATAEYVPAASVPVYFGDNTEYYEVAYTYGDIHCDKFS
jgi:hypothetical protein